MSLFINPFFYAFARPNEDGRNALVPTLWLGARDSAGSLSGDPAAVCKLEEVIRIAYNLSSSI